MKKAISNTIESKIYLLRGQKVMLSVDLAALYGVEAPWLQSGRKYDGGSRKTVTESPI